MRVLPTVGLSVLLDNRRAIVGRTVLRSGRLVGDTLIHAIVREPSLYKILVVDDEVTNRNYVRRLLELQGYTDVRTFADADELIESSDALDADIVFLDLHMPGRDGFSVLETLSELQVDGRFVPVIVLTSDTTPGTRQRALQLGASDFVTRPFDRDELLLRVRNLLDRRDIHRQIMQANQILEEQIQLSESELRRAHAEMLVRLARAAEYRDDQTGMHTWRVGHLARHIAQELSATQRFVDLIGLAARLHDVGKIGIPDSVLLKPGPLCHDEFEIMKAHTTIGASLLSGGHSALMMMAATIALDHHESWNGGGYPNGKVADAIPREGRIVAVADVFDALTHSRAYKDVWSEADALAEIRRQKGVKFDPDIVEAFERAYINGATTNIEAPRDDEDELSRAAVTDELFRGASCT